MSDDLISRSALKEEFAKHEDRKGYLIGDWENIIDNAPPVEQECYITGAQWDEFMKEHKRPQGERWIPVSERLPEEANQAYLVTVDYGDGVVCSCQRFFFGEGIGWNDNYVTAWQPLPKPYKEAENEDN